MQYRVYSRQAGYIYDIIKTKKKNPTLLKILREQLDKPWYPWTKSWRKIEALLGNIFRFKKKKHLLQYAVTQKAEAYVISVKRQHSTLNFGIGLKFKTILMTPNQVKFYVKSGAEMLNWVTGTKTALDLNIMFAHSANYWALILSCQSHILYLSAL